MTTRAVARLTVAGTVERGDGRGRVLGYRTANIAVAGLGLPHVVWAGHVVRSEGTIHVAVVSVGIRPTFYGEQGQELLEAHLLDFDGDLYGEDVVVSLVLPLRDERPFPDADALVAQMREDVAATRRWALGEAS